MNRVKLLGSVWADSNYWTADFFKTPENGWIAEKITEKILDKRLFSVEYLINYII